MTALAEAVERDLGALNTFARGVLDGPDDLPAVGSWIGAAHAETNEPIAVAHLFTGWNRASQNLGIRCSQYRPGWRIAAAYSGWRHSRRDPGLVLTVDATPPADACQRCLRLSAGPDAVR